MKKRTAFILFTFLTALVLISGCFQNTGSQEEKNEPDTKQQDSSKQPSQPASTTATVNFDTSMETKISRGFQGQNNPIQKGGVEYLDDDLIQIINRAELGWIRFGGGTVVGDYNWKLGIPEESKIVQYKASGDHDSFEQPHIFTVAKGGQQLSDFYELTRLTSTKIIVTVNPFTDTPDSIGDMAKFVKDNQIDVEYWQLGNEPYYFRYIGNMAKKPQFFTSATDYLNKVKPFSDAIKAVLPDAKTLVYYSPDPADRSNNEITNYQDRFWDGITFHRYDGNGKDTASAIKDTNTQLSNWEKDIDQYIKKSWSNVPIVVTEYGVKIKGELEGTHYAGMYVAESALRASKHTNIKYMGGYRLYGGLANEGNPRSEELEAAY